MEGADDDIPPEREDVLPSVVKYVEQVAETVIGVGAETCSATCSSSEVREILRAFVDDRGVSVVVLIGSRSQSGASLLEVRGEAGIDWKGGEQGSCACVLVKRGDTLTTKQPIGQQIQLISLGTSLVDSLHTHIKSSFVPLLESFFSPSSASGASGRPSHQEVGGLRERGANASAFLLVRKKVAELELALRGCQEAVKIPEVSLKEHLVPDVARLAADLAVQADLEGKETAKENFLSKLKGSEELKNAMCNSVLSWHRELSDMSSRFDKQLMSDDTSPMHEREFWLRMERVLSSVEEQSKLPEVDLTLEMVKRLKVRGHIPKQFEEDVGVMRTKLESARKYCILVKDFPVADVEAAQDMVSLGASIVQVFEHVRKNLVRSRYPVGRAAKLLEAVSSQVNDKLDQTLRGKQVMDMRYDDFSRLAGFDSSKALKSAEGSGDGVQVETCQQLFLVWETKEKEFMAETSRLRRYNKDVSDSDRLDAVHRDLAQRVEELAEFRRQHESLRRVVTKVSRAAQSTGAKVGGLVVLNEAYQRFKSVDVLDVSAGQDSWGRAMSEYRSMADTVEADMATRLRDSLASSRSSNDMFQIFSVFSALLVRPKIKSAVHEYQNKLIMQVKEDVRMLQDKFKRKYAGSEAERVARVRNIPPVAGSIIWARQVERQLQMYMRRMECVIGEGWEDHVEGQKLRQECEAFGSKLDASLRFRRWQDEVLQQNRENPNIYNAEAFLSRIFLVKTHGNVQKLHVNFNDNLVSLLREGRSLSQLSGLKLIPSIEVYAKELKRIHPYAISVSEAIRVYFLASSLVSDSVSVLLASQMNKMHMYIQLGIDQRVLAASKDLQREIYRDLGQDFGRSSHFLDDFIRKRELEHLDVYSRKLHECALEFEGKVQLAVAKSAAVEAALERLLSCPLEKSILSGNISAIQSLVAELELASFSNLATWVRKIDARVEKVLAVRMQQLLDMWIRCFKLPCDDQADLDFDDEYKEEEPTEYVRGLARNAQALHEIRIKGGLLLVDPPVEAARAKWMEQLAVVLSTIGNLPRLKHSAYSVLNDSPEAAARGAETYENVVEGLPVEAMRMAYDTISLNVRECQLYVSSWLNYQALWDLDAGDAVARLGSDVGQWLQVLGQLREARSVFDTVESSKSFGPITIDFAKVQHGVSVKYEAWNRELMSVFSRKLAVLCSEMLTNIRDAREKLEQDASEKSTGQVVAFLTLVQGLTKKKQEWSESVQALAEGEKMLIRNRFKLPADWLHVENVEGEWMALKQILPKKETVLREQMSSLKSKVIQEDKSASARVHAFLVDWSASKPVSGKIKPSEAVEVLSVFETRLSSLQEESRLIFSAKGALGIESMGGDRLLSCASELTELKEVWQSLVRPGEELQSCADTAWNAVIPRKIRASLDQILDDLQGLPQTSMQFAACEQMVKAVRGHIKSLVIITDLRSQSMKPRHWESISLKLGVGWNITDLVLGDLWAVCSQENEHLFRDILAMAQGELGLEEFLKLVREHWNVAKLEVVAYKHKVSLIRGWDDIFSKLGEHSGSLASMRNSPYYKVFEGEASSWEDRLNSMRENMELWAEIQRRWVYLEGIFLASADIKEQLPIEYAKFKTIDNEFVDLMRGVAKKPLILDVMGIPDLSQVLFRLDDMLTKIQKSLYEYLEKKRCSFPRFYFIGDDDLLEIIGSGTNLAPVQRHLRKMFAGIQSLQVDGQGDIMMGMQSPQGEYVAFSKGVDAAEDPEANIWLFKVEAAMKMALACSVSEGLDALTQVLSNLDSKESGLVEWLDNQPAQAALLSMQISLCRQIESSFEPGGKMQESCQQCQKLLGILADYVLRDMNHLLRRKMEQLVGELVHQEGVATALVKSGICSSSDFSWQFYMRFYPDKGGDVRVCVANAAFPYGFEYLGVAERIVQTPLTDRAYLTLTQALHSRMGGSPFGPAGTGKTETVKALSQQLGRLVLVFNCDESFDLHAMGRIFLGLCQTGAWGCFDEFNRLEERILSAVSQQILTIQTALRQGAKEVELINRMLPLNHSTGIFVTMNPGYAGRSNLPDNLKQLFRSVAMSRPDSELIAQIMLYSQGFREARMLSAKVVPLFRLCKDQLSPCTHYDFGLRALKSVLVGAGGIKRRADAESSESQLVLQSFCGSIVPKLIPEDIPMFYALLSDVFPGSNLPQSTSDQVRLMLLTVCKESHFSPEDEFVSKVMQLSEIARLHHGIMLVGPPGSGKTSSWRLLFEALRRIETDAPSPHFYVINPKALTKASLFGHLDATTREWSDGVLTSILRKVVAGQRGDQNNGRHWIVLDGDVDPEWVENLNSVLDDNKMLTLPNGERLALPDNVRILFEVEDLRYATPATVSRCGMIWFGSSNVRPDMQVRRSMACLSSGIDPSSAISSAQVRQQQSALAMTDRECWSSLESILSQGDLLTRAFAHAGGLEHVMPFSAHQAADSFISLLRGAVSELTAFMAESGEDADKSWIKGFLAKHVALSLAWALGGSLPASTRSSMSSWISGNATTKCPSEATLYDWEVLVSEGDWSRVEDCIPATEVEAARVSGGDVLVPTAETKRHEDLLCCLLRQGRHTLLCGPPGSGKTMTVAASLRNMPEAQLVSLNFSSSTSPALLLGTLEHYCECVRTPDGIHMRPRQSGKTLVILCDEINLPAEDAYGTQHVISFIRQLCEHRGFWRPKDLTWIHVDRVVIVGACNPPSDEGRVALSPRFLRHTALLHIDFPGKSSLRVIYRTFSRAVLSLVPSLRLHEQSLGDCMVEYYTMCSERFSRDTQAHYIFSPRELSRWVRALYEALRCNRGCTLDILVQILVHEGLRIFHDRLVNAKEKDWANETIDGLVKRFFPNCDLRECLRRPLIFSSWLGKEYSRVERDELTEFVKARMSSFNEEELGVPLVVFDQMLDHVLRIDRVLKQPMGHSLLVGASGAGKTVMTKFVAWLNSLSVFQIKAHRKYGQEDFEADLRKVMKRTGCQGESVCFIFDESNALSSGFLELMNALLASGEVPGLFEGDDWVSLVHKCREAATKDGLMLDTEEELYKRFIEQVRRNLHVVFTMNPSSPDYGSRSASSPALFNRCVVDWVGDWDQDALVQIATHFTLPLAIQEDERHGLVEALMYSHDAAHAGCLRERRIREKSIFVTPRHYVDAVNQFVKVFEEKKSAAQDQQQHLSVGLRKLTETRSDVEQLAESLAARGKELDAKESLASEKLESMVINQQEAEKRREGTKALQLEVQGQQNELAQRRSKVELELAEAGPAVEEAKAAVQGIKRQQLDEVRSMMHPPGGVRTTMEAICVMLYGLKNPKWDEIRKSIRRDDFIPSIVGFNTQDFKSNSSRLSAIQVMIEDPDFSFDVINRSSKACGPLVLWVRAQYMYATVLDTVAPLKAEMDILEAAAAKGQTKLDALEADAKEIEDKIAKYKEEYALLISEAQNIKSEMSRVRSRVGRSKELLLSLEVERERWQRQSQAFGAQTVSLAGNAAVSSTFLAYMGMFDQEIRETLREGLLNFLEKVRVPVMADMVFAEYLSKPEDRVFWKAHGLPDDDLCIENAVILERCGRYPLMVDPSDQGTSFLQSALSGQKLVKSSLVDDSFIKHLESAMRFGTPLLITDVESIDQILNPVLNREISKVGGRTLIRVGVQEIDVSPSFRLYLSTRDASCRFSADLCSRVTLVNFTVTPGGLRRQTLAAALRSERPDVDEQRADLEKLQGEYMTKLMQCEEALLMALSESEGNILDNDSLIATLERIKGEGKELEDRLASQEVVRQSVAAVTRVYEPLAAACSAMFFTLQSMAELHALYQFSVGWFMDVFGFVLKTKDLTGNEASRPEMLTRSMFQQTLGRASISVLERHRLCLSLRFAQLHLASQGHGLDAMELAFLFERNRTALDNVDMFKDAMPFTNKQLLRLSSLAALPNFSALREHVGSNTKAWSALLEAPLAEKHVPSMWGDALLPHEAEWRGLLLLSALRPDRLAAGARALIRTVFGDTTSKIDDLPGLIDEATGGVKCIILSSAAGFDAGARVDSLATSRRVQYKAFAMGSVDMLTAADAAVTWAAEAGGWALLKNVHLAADWLPHLEKLLHRIEPSPGFRLFLTVEQDAAASLPQSLILNSQVVVMEPAAGLKASLSRSIAAIPSERMCREPRERGRVYMLIAWLHGVVAGRVEYCPGGWSKHYEFSESDLWSALDTADELLDKTAGTGSVSLDKDEMPWKALRELICTACYGGRIDNEFDFEALTSILGRLICHDSLSPGYSLTPIVEQGGLCLPDAMGPEELREWGSSLAAEEVPGWLGLSHDSDVLLHSQQATRMLADWSALDSNHQVDESLRGAGASAAGGEPSWSGDLVKSIDEWLEVLKRVDDGSKCSIETKGQDEMAPVLRCFDREFEQGINILKSVSQDLLSVKLVAEGKAHRTNAVRELTNVLRKAEIPKRWLAHYGVTSSLKVGEWIADLASRLRHLASLLSRVNASEGAKDSLEVWVGGLFHPGAFITASRQMAARYLGKPLETLHLCVSLSRDSEPRAAQFQVVDAWMQGATWDATKGSLVDAGSTGHPLPHLTCFWAQQEMDKASTFGETKSMPVYLTIERRDLVAVVKLAVEPGSNLCKSWFEIGPAIILWDKE